MLAQYYERIADRILQHIVGRPLSLYRCPQGIEREAFFQKQLHDMPREHLRDVIGKNGTKDQPYILVDDVQGLVTLAQWSVLEIHLWGCRADDLDAPDRLTFDLDPGPDVPWSQIVEGAKGVRFLLEQHDMECSVKTSGGKGLHVVTELDAGWTWSELKRFAAQIARRIADADPKHYTATMIKDQRRGKVYIDYLRNTRGATCVAPYSPRARRGAPVSMPVAWASLDERCPHSLTALAI